MNPNQYFTNKKVLIMGLGTKGGGVASAKFAHKHGAFITITDLHDAEYLKDSLFELEGLPKSLVLNQHRFEDFENNDIIIKNPGIKYENKYLQHALKHNKQIETPISLFNKFYHKHYIGITGTKGKSYTTALVTHLLSVFNKNIIAAGNNGISPLLFLDKDKTFVLELSSWQLHEMGLQKKSPHIACWLNFFPDHMNYYANIEEYYIDKLQITNYQTEDDFLIVPFGNTKLRNIQTKAHKFIFSTENLEEYSLNINESICYINKNKVYIATKGYTSEICPLKKIKENYAAHHLELILASICITYVYAIDNNFPLTLIKKKIQQGIATFKGLSYRFETIYHKENLEIINDSAASTPESTIEALKSTKYQPTILITGGGSHKNLSYSQLALEIVKKNTFVIFYANDETSKLIRKELIRVYYDKYLIVENLKVALDQAVILLIKQNGTILFSPACSGYPVFRDMFERGDIFYNFVKNKSIQTNA